MLISFGVFIATGRFAGPRKRKSDAYEDDRMPCLVVGRQAEAQLYPCPAEELELL